MTELVDRVTTMPQRLRSDTSDLHAAVEAAADLPASIRTRADYGDLLSTFHAAQAEIETAVLAPQWHQGWRELEVDLTRHTRLALLVDDLATLDRTPDLPPPAVLALSNVAEALGCLYVVEGSAIGRRVLSPILQQRLGDIPTRFFDGNGHHPRAWRSLQRSLTSGGADAEGQASILAGARKAFAVYLDQLSRRAERRRWSVA